MGLTVPDFNHLPLPRLARATSVQWAGSGTSSAEHRAHGKSHQSLSLSSLLATGVCWPMGNPWGFIQLGLLQDQFHTAEPENTSTS